MTHIAHTIIQPGGLTNIAGQVRRQITGEIDQLSQSLKTIFRTLGVTRLIPVASTVTFFT